MFNLSFIAPFGYGIIPSVIGYDYPKGNGELTVDDGRGDYLNEEEKDFVFERSVGGKKKILPDLWS